MDCNKDEAIKAKEIAVRKMRNYDFAAACRFALKARRLDNNLEGISQIVIICDVHCTPEKKLDTGESDWYGVLQLDQSADDETIRKQFKKLAVQLHPDRNKFPGAESAFRKICDAQDVLLYKVKRSFHDKNCNFPVKETDSKPGETTNSNSFTGFKSEKLSFWTKCPCCDVRYHYRMKFMRKLIPCQHCSKLYIAFELSTTSVPKQKRRLEGDFCNVGGEKEATLGSNIGRRERFDVFGYVSEVEIEEFIRERKRNRTL